MTSKQPSKKSSESSELPAETEERIERDNLGRFVAGVSGNKLGRPKGSKNRTTVMKQAMEEALTRDLADEFAELTKVAFQMAKEGDKDMLKFLLGDVMKEVRRSEPEEDHINLKDVEVSITQYFGDAAKTAARDAVDAEFKEIKEASGLDKPS